MSRSNLLLVALSGIFSLVVIEGFLRWRPEYQALAPVPSYVFCAGPDRTGQAHELFGYTSVPDAAYFEQKSEADGWAVHIINSDGFRDLFNSGENHVIVLGDSFTKGALVNNDETFSHLLDLWNPDFSFHNFGVSGYGTRQSLAVYKSVSDKMEHDLIIVAYFMGNDLRNNLTGDASHDGEALYVAPRDIEHTTVYETLQDINSKMRSLRSYNLLYSAMRPLFGGRETLSHEQISEGINVTESVLSDLIMEARKNGSDILLMALPSWNEMNNLEDPDEADQQRDMLKRSANQWDNVYLLDMTDIFAQIGSDRIYGIKDKHLSRYGHYVTAEAIHDWINDEWERGPHPGRPAPAYQPPSAPVDPDCALIPEYQENFRRPDGEQG